MDKKKTLGEDRSGTSLAHYVSRQAHRFNPLFKDGNRIASANPAFHKWENKSSGLGSRLHARNLATNFTDSIGSTRQMQQTFDRTLYSSELRSSMEIPLVDCQSKSKSPLKPQFWSNIRGPYQETDEERPHPKRRNKKRGMTNLLKIRQVHKFMQDENLHSVDRTIKDKKPTRSPPPVDIIHVNETG